MSLTNNTVPSIVVTPHEPLSDTFIDSLLNDNNNENEDKNNNTDHNDLVNSSSVNNQNVANFDDIHSILDLNDINFGQK